MRPKTESEGVAEAVRAYQRAMTFVRWAPGRGKPIVWTHHVTFEEP